MVVASLFERDGDRCYDTSPVIDADGTLLGRTRMVHITEFAGFHEQGYYAPGDLGVPVYNTRAGRVGVAICYDRHFPEVMRGLALGGADLVIVPQAGTVGEWPEGLYEAEVRVAAFQNGYFVALCNRVGREESLDFAGESFVCGPDGVVLAIGSTGLDCRVEAFELHAGVGGGELPIHSTLGAVAGVLPGGYLRPQRLLLTDPSVQALAAQHRQFRLRHVEPTAMLGRVMDLQPLDQPPGLFGSERLVQTPLPVRVQVVHHQRHLLRLRVLFIDQLADHMCEVDLGAPVGHLDPAATRERLERHEQVGHPVPLVLVVGHLPRP